MGGLLFVAVIFGGGATLLCYRVLDIDFLVSVCIGVIFAIVIFFKTLSNPIFWLMDIADERREARAEERRRHREQLERIAELEAELRESRDELPVRQYNIDARSVHYHVHPKDDRKDAPKEKGKKRLLP